MGGDTPMWVPRQGQLNGKPPSPALGPALSDTCGNGAYWNDMRIPT